MALTAPPSASPRPLPPAGNQYGRLVLIADVGTQDETFEGKAKTMRKVIFTFELPTLKHTFDEAKGPEPFQISKKFTFSMGERATLRKFIVAWRGKNYDSQKEADAIDFEKMIGKDCLINIVHKEKQDKSGMTADITGVSKLMPGMVVPPQIAPSIIYSIGHKYGGTYSKLPPWIQKIVAASHELKGVAAPAATAQGSPATAATPTPEPEEDDVPF